MGLAGGFSPLASASVNLIRFVGISEPVVCGSLSFFPARASTLALVARRLCAISVCFAFRVSGG